MFDRGRSLRELSKHLAETDLRKPLTTRLCFAAVTMLRVDGASITIGGDTSLRAVLCATNDVAELLESLQVTLGEGPALDAQRTRLAVTASGTEMDQRWPVLAGETVRLLGGRPHLLSLPMRPHSRVLGVLTLNAEHEPTPVTDLDEAQFIADAIGVAVLGNWEGIAELSSTWVERDKVSQATGMVVAQLGVGPDDAVAVLRAHAFAIGATLEAVAGSVLRREVDFSGTNGRAAPGTEDDDE